MTTGRIESFGGEVPRLASRRLPGSTARTASNTKLYSGELRSFLRPSLVYTSPKAAIKSAYRMYDSTGADFWITWTEDVDAVKAPIANDTTFRLYYTGDTSGTGGPKKTNLALATSAGDFPHDYYELGVPAPAATTLGTISGGSGSALTQAYVVTWVTAWGEEGPPSPVVTGTGKTDSTSWFINRPALQTGKYNIVSWNIYRAIVGTSGVSNYYFVSNQLVGVTSYNDNHTVAPDSLIVLNATIPTWIVAQINSEWAGPPTDMVGLCSGPNGMMAGFNGNQVDFSEPYFPHAWPLRYRYAVNWPVMWCGWFGSSLLVATKGRPYIFTGSHPSAMSQIQVERDDMPCVSKRSGTLFSFGGAFAVPNGLALIGAGVPVIATEDYMTRDEWQSRCFPSTILAKSFQDRYFGFFTSGDRTGFVFDRTAKEAGMVFLNNNVNGLYTDPETSKLYLLQGSGIYEWDADTLNATNYDWKSKTYTYPNLTKFGAFQVDADYSALQGEFAANLAQIAADNVVNSAIIAQVTEGTATSGKLKGELGSHMLGGYQAYSDAAASDGPTNGRAWGIMLGGSLLIGGLYSSYDNRGVTFQAFAYNYDTAAMELKHSVSLTDSLPHRLPGGFSSDAWEFRVAGNIPVHCIRWSETMNEIRAV